MPHLSLHFLLLVIMGSACAGNVPQIYYEGEVGGNVTVTCPVNNNKSVRLMYFQRDDIFVNGYYIDDPKPLNYWENTELDRPNSAVHIFNLNVSHTGNYDCVIQYDDQGPVTTTTLHLNVTAPYKSPMVTNSCKEDNGVLGCNVTCSFHNGFPKKEIRFNLAEAVNGSDRMRIIDESFNQDPITKLYNISITAFFRCSNGEQKVFCSVGDAISQTCSVCTPEDKPVSAYVIAAAIVVVIVLVLMAVCLISKICKKRKPGAQIPNLEEGLRLNESKQETEAS